MQNAVCLMIGSESCAYRVLYAQYESGAVGISCLVTLILKFSVKIQCQDLPES